MTDVTSVESFATMTGAEVFVYELEALRAGDTGAAQAARARGRAGRRSTVARNCTAFHDDLR